VIRFAATLWDLLVPKPADAPPPASRPGRSSSSRGRAMRDRYDALAVEMKKTYGLRVHKWRTDTSGCAWELRGRNGSVTPMIAAPYPKGPVSCAVFLHEVGHHAIGFKTYRPRCLEEYHAWKWALDTMRARGFNVTPAVERRYTQAMRYAVAKARRRGIKRIPTELIEFV
jgi:hypothetical protein